MFNVKYQQSTIIMKILHTNKNETRKQLSDFAIPKGVEEGGFDIPGLWSPSGVSTIIKLNVGVAFWIT